MRGEGEIYFKDVSYAIVGDGRSKISIWVSRKLNILVRVGIEGEQI